ncbi:hypothetical protein B0F90DRAFT_1683727 [Multifurca ochricompacta]|uniref:Uncharacterized protein n=1 Tax=Multifurca ochricompacta TaxID=376703 RepID=A0AAD4QSA0_9AGAM|nr:hypothetical protein B0F90DRAFT_1683727 [Multifurca ochricompacta]
MLPTVWVYVAPSSLKRIQKVYGNRGGNVQVKPLQFSETELDAPAFLSLRWLSTRLVIPCYTCIQYSVFYVDFGENYTYSAFMAKLNVQQKEMIQSQPTHLKQRLDLLQTFTQPEEKRFASGVITIIDLSDSFVDAVLAGARSRRSSQGPIPIFPYPVIY